MKLNKKNNYGINDHNNDELKIIIIYAEFYIKDWKNNNKWRVYVISRNDIQNYKFENIILYFFPYANEKIYENCFNNKNKKIRY